MKHRKNVLLLFDIDGTLVSQFGKRGITIKRLPYAVNKVFNTNTNVDMLSMSGQVDTETLLELAERGGIKRSAAKKRLNEMYYFATQYFRKHLKDYDAHVHEGVRPLLSRLRSEGYVLGLTTGNLKPIAYMKLKKVGLLKFFDMGSFGETSTQRSDLLEQAIKTANRKFKTKFTKNRVLYFGDTPRDIIAARKAKVRIISVTTGRHTRGVLKKEKPDYILDGLADQDRIFKIINQISK